MLTSFQVWAATDETALVSSSTSTRILLFRCCGLGGVLILQMRIFGPATFTKVFDLHRFR
jgi:hypothetical protein